MSGREADSNPTGSPGPARTAGSARAAHDGASASAPADPFGERAARHSFTPRLPDVALPRPGGALRGIGEKFAVAPATGTGRIVLPLPFAAARMAPQLQLGYDSGGGNGVFGMGWSLDLPSIRRKTDKGLPRYDDAGESDVYVLSGAEDLVPLLDASGQRHTRLRKAFGRSWQVTGYRPRIESLYARIERWRDADSGVIQWRLISRDNQVSIFGDTPQSRVADPSDALHIFEWRLRRSFDDKGNATVYEYAGEDGAGVDLAAAHEAGRTAPGRACQSYLRRIRYGNRTPYAVDWNATAEPALPTDWMFTVSLDYGDHAGAGIDPDRPWPVRPDPFSSYRAGFEVRTYRRVRRLLFFSDFPGEPTIGAQGLVRSLDLLYADQQGGPDPRGPGLSFLVAVTQTGYRTEDGVTHTQSLPAVEFTYTAPAFDGTVRAVDRDSLGNLPEGVDGTRFRWLDLDGEGLQGILSTAPGGWYYKRNLSAANLQPRAGQSAAAAPRFASLRALDRIPGHGDAAGRQFLALAGDGMLDVAELGGAQPGFYARTAQRDFASFRRFDSLPQLDWNDPNLRFIDLTGDGLADILISEEGLFTWYAAMGTAGFASGGQLRLPWDEDRGPRVVFADGTDTIFVADMSGDGLNDIVRVRNGEACYWPNLGYGRFGARVTMDHAPRFDRDDAFDPGRIRLADIDGTGAVDVLYVGQDGVRAWFNRSGNEFSAPTLLAVFPAADWAHTVQALDLLGTGTSCLVWSSPGQDSGAAALRYVDLMGGMKPHLLSGVRNNLGAETRIAYAPSTRFYLADELAGRPWVTRLPFPVWTVERVETVDWIGRNRLVSRHAYHHGYFDGLEQEFRGFGMVEQWDTEEFRSDLDFQDGGFAGWGDLSSVPPILTRTWMHTGAFLEAAAVDRQYESEYWLEPALRGAAGVTGLAAMRPAASHLPDGLAGMALREAQRALKGQTLRVEVFDAGTDGPAGNPYVVTTNSFTVEHLQARGPNRHACFAVHPCEAVTLHYERAGGDPRVVHEITLQTNAYGEPLRQLAVAYPRRAGAVPEPQLDAATQARLAYDQARPRVRAYLRTDTNAIDDVVAQPDTYRAPLAAAADIAEITGAVPGNKGFGAASLFSLAELDGSGAAPGIWPLAWSGSHDLPFESVAAADLEGTGPVPGLARRFVARLRTRYRSDDLATLLPAGTLQARALPGQGYRAAFTTTQLDALLGSLATPGLLAEAGYVQLTDEDGWWAPSGTVRFSPGDTDTPAQELAFAQSHFWLPVRLLDAFGATARVSYDDYALLPVSVRDPAGNLTSCSNDYRVLVPALVTDANGNRCAAAFDALGITVATAQMGKAGEVAGDTLAGVQAELDASVVAAFMADPAATAASLLGGASTRVVLDIGAWQRTRTAADPAPPAVAVISRETHGADLAPGDATALQLALAYSDGFGRVVQHKTRVAPGPLVDGGPDLPSRWRASGWTVFNNKGLAVRRYEPFFTATGSFEFAVQTGVAVLQCHDPLGRVVGVLHPDATWEKTVVAAWRQEIWDGNDTVLAGDPRNDADVGPHFRRALGSAPFTSWHDARAGGSFGTDAEAAAAAQDAAIKAADHAGTPSVSHVDPLGRTCLAVVDAGHGARFATRTALDSEGRPLAVFDALGRRAEQYALPAAGGTPGYLAGTDMAGHPMYRVNADAGARRSLHAVDGKPVRVWDDLARTFRLEYDAARRPLRRYVATGTGPESLVEFRVYGEGQPAANLCGRVFRHYDGAGYAENTRFDFKGNLLVHARQLATSFSARPDWSPLAALADAAALDAAAQGAGLIPSGDGGRDRFSGSTAYDALNRPTQVLSPVSTGMRPNVTQYAYDAGGQLATIDLWMQQAAAPAGRLDPATADRHVVTAVAYNARSQRSAVSFGNGVQLEVAFDPVSFRMTRLTTTRPASFGADARGVQDLRYFYDPVGNLTRIRDDADLHGVVYFRNQRVEPSADYRYDALYRLKSASGREHLGQTGGSLAAALQVAEDDGARQRLPQPGDGNAMGTYVETYDYDAVGNLLAMAHAVASGGWTRRYAYAEPSRVAAGETGNRLSATSLPGDPAAGPWSAACQHDAHGNMTRMPHLPLLAWNEDNQLAATTTTAGSAAPMTWYACDASAMRVRKVTGSAAGRRTRERIYLGDTEVYREFAADGSTVTLSRETWSPGSGGAAAVRIESRTQGSDPGPAQQVRYQFGNHLGSASLELADDAGVISYEEYFPYGSTSYQAVAAATDVARRQRYCGKERDDETGLCYHGTRYYAPWLGRWTACDPAGLADGPNLYPYALDRPTTLVDPDGMQARDHPEDRDTHQFWPREDPMPSDPAPARPRSPGFWERIGNAFRSIGQALGNAARAIGRALSDAWDWTRRTLAAAGRRLRDAAVDTIHRIGQGLTSAGHAIAHAISAAGRAIAGAVMAAGRAIAHAAATAWRAVTTAARRAWEWTRSAARAAGHWLYEAASTIWDSIPFRIIGHLTWGLLGTSIGAALTLVNLTVGNLIVAVHNAFNDQAHRWGYATIDLGGPRGGLPVIGNYGGLFNLAPSGAAVTIGPFVYFEGPPSGAQSIRQGYSTRGAAPSGVIYGNQVPLRIEDHEKGHTDQNLIYGPLSPLLGVIFSLIPNAVGADTRTSDWYWYDRQANRFSGANNPFHPNTAVHP